MKDNEQVITTLKIPLFGRPPGEDHPSCYATVCIWNT